MSRVLFCVGVVVLMAALPAMADDPARSRTDSFSRTDDGGLLHERTYTRGDQSRTLSKESHRTRTEDGFRKDSVLTGPGGGQREVTVEGSRRRHGVDLERSVTGRDGTTRTQRGQIRGRRNADGSRARGARFENDRGERWHARQRSQCEDGRCVRTRAGRAPDGRQRVRRDGRR